MPPATKLQGPDIQRIRILDGAGLVIQKVGVRSQ